MGRAPYRKYYERDSVEDKEGRIITGGAPEKIMTSDMLASVFGVDAEVITVKSGKPYIIYHGIIMSNVNYR